MDLHIKWLNQEYMKTQRNWEEVDNRMNVTIEIRRKMISDKAPFKDILRLFPFLRCPYQVSAIVDNDIEFCVMDTSVSMYFTGYFH